VDPRASRSTVHRKSNGYKKRGIDTEIKNAADKQAIDYAEDE
jgi:hypothetical protein